LLLSSKNGRRTSLADDKLLAPGPIA